MAETQANPAQPPRRPTLRDVAELAGCSTAVVSTVVNRAGGRSGASVALAKRIREAADKLGYRPHFASRVLLRNSAQTIGVFLPPNPDTSAGYNYVTQLLFGIERTCQQHSFDLLAINLGGDVSPKVCGHKFGEGRIDGLVMIQVMHGEKWVAELAKRHPNIAAINYHSDAASVSTLNFNDRAATAAAVDHLVSLGHRRIAYVGAHQARGRGATLRCEGYRSAMAAHNLPVREEWVFDYTVPAVREKSDAARAAGMTVAGAGGPFSSFEAFGAYAAEHIWHLGDDRPTAMVSYADGMAIGAMLRLIELGVDVPGQMSVVGLDDALICQVVRPQLTTVRQPLEQMGRQASELVIETADRLRAGQAYKPTHTSIAPELVVRQSTAPIK